MAEVATLAPDIFGREIRHVTVSDEEWRSAKIAAGKRPFGGPEAVLAYLSRYAHRAAISNSRLVACDEGSVTFRWKDDRARGKGPP